MSLITRMRCWFGYHVVWLGDLRIVPAEEHVTPETCPTQPNSFDSPCLECGTLATDTPCTLSVHP